MTKNRYLISADRIFTGTEWLQNHYLLIEDHLIQAIGHLSQAPEGLPHHSFADCFISAGWIDVQVNGGGGLLFNNATCVETLRTMVEAHRLYGTCAILPTLITDTWSKMLQAVCAVQDAINSGVSGILGIHLEGPFLNPDFRGIHLQKYMQVPTDSLLAELPMIQGGCSMMTIAPEVFTCEQIEQLASKGWKLFCGHSGATYEELEARFASGVIGLTHFFNAMRPMSSREPGVYGFGLESQQTWCSIIADGLHVADANLRLLARCKPHQILLVTDAMALVGSSDTSFDLQGRTILLRDGKCLNDDGVFSGANVGMNECVKKMMQATGLPLEEVLRMASFYPAKMLGIDDSYGQVDLCLPANLVVCDESLNVHATVVQGQIHTSNHSL